jgi:hypothetical protein
MQDLEPPIQNLDAFDIVGERKDGGVDLVVSCSGPLDSSITTLGLIERKVRAYLATIAHENFARIYPAAEFGAVRIFISCECHVSGAARELIDGLGVTASKEGVSLLLVRWHSSRINFPEAADRDRRVGVDSRLCRVSRRWAPSSDK